MIQINEQQLAELLPYAELADALRQAFRSAGFAPARQHHTVVNSAGEQTHLLVMPAWQAGEVIGIKVATVCPANAAKGIASVNATYLLLDADTGVPRALIDGNELTRRRTAAASVLAARYLAKPHSRVLLVVGTGHIATHLLRAYCAEGRIQTVFIWGRRYEQACKLACQSAAQGLRVEAVRDLEKAVPQADIISCATLSAEALVFGKWLIPGQHLDLVGSFTPAMREVDEAAVLRAELYVDTREGALQEAGELVQPMRDGRISKSDIRGDLFELTRETCKGRSSARAITLFKSVGNGLEDLAAAAMACDRLDSGR